MNDEIRELNMDELNVVAGSGKNSTSPKGSGLFEINDFSFDIEQVLNIGSQSSGAGAGKITFNPF
jgi:hypothetical protein